MQPLISLVALALELRHSIAVPASPPDINAVRQWVRDYTAAGYHPIELVGPQVPKGGWIKSPGKQPVGMGWQKSEQPKDATLFPDGCNIGLKMGRQPDGTFLVCVDVDTTDPAEIAKLATDWPDTLVAQTGKGRFHFLYLWPDTLPQPSNSVRLGGFDVDLRAEGGQIVVCPSVHPDTDQPYQWLTSCTPALLPVETAQTLLTLAHTRRATRADAAQNKGNPPSLLVHADPTAPASPGCSPSVDDGELIDLSQSRWLTTCKKIAKSNSPVAAAFETLMGGDIAAQPGERDSTIYRICWELAGYLPNVKPESLASFFVTALSKLEADHPFDAPCDVADKFRRAVAKRAEKAAEGIRLALSSSGTPRPNLTNALRVLEKDPALLGRIGYDNFASRVTVLSKLPWGTDGETFPREWLDRDASEFAHYCFEAHRLEIKTAVAFEAVIVTCHRNQFHPVREYLLGCVAAWDGVPRIDTWLIDHLGAADTPYTRKVGAWWLMQGVARVAAPGCQADYCLILEGEQGVGKSKTLRALASPAWFGDDLEDVGNRDAAQKCAGKWITELSELAANRKADINKVKAFITRPVDRYRVPYGRVAEDFPRQCIFAGSTNDAEYLSDPTGARRFWPVTVDQSQIDVAALVAVRDQIWAEAAVRVAAGELYYPSTDAERALCWEAAESRRVVDCWEERITQWAANPQGLSNKDEITTHWLLTNVLEQGVGRRQDDNRLACALTALGWGRSKGRGRSKIWVPPVPLVIPVRATGPNVVQMPLKLAMKG